MVVLREYRPDDGPFVMAFELKVGIASKDYRDFDFDIDRSSLPGAGALRFRVLGWTDC